MFRYIKKTKLVAVTAVYVGGLLTSEENQIHVQWIYAAS